MRRKDGGAPLLYGRSRLGILKPTGVSVNESENHENHNVDVAGTEHDSVYVRRVNRKNYELVDHLGNIRVVVTDVKETENVDANNQPQGPYEATLVATNTYYPFGMLRPGQHWSSESYRYGYNGKEMDNEWSGSGNSYDYGFRIYNPRIAKFLSVDPLTKSYPMLTPYQFASNTPIQAIDLDGLEADYVSNKRSDGTTAIKLIFNTKLVNSSSLKLTQEDMAVIRTVLEYSIPKIMQGKDEEKRITYTSELRSTHVASATQGEDYYIELVDHVKNDDGTRDWDAVGKVDEIGNTQVNRMQIEFSQAALDEFRAFARDLAIVRDSKKRYELGPAKVKELIESLQKDIPYEAVTVAHELGHTGGLYHIDVEHNLMTEDGAGNNLIIDQFENIIETIDDAKKPEENVP